MSASVQYVITPSGGYRQNRCWEFSQLRGVSFEILSAVFPGLGQEVLVPHADVPPGYVAMVLGIVITCVSGGTVTQTTGEWRGTKVDGAGTPVHTPVISIGASRDGGPTIYQPVQDLPLYTGDKTDVGASRGLGVQAVPLTTGGIIRLLGFAQIAFGKLPGAGTLT